VLIINCLENFGLVILQVLLNGFVFSNPFVCPILAVLEPLARTGERRLPRAFGTDRKDRLQLFEIAAST
jgi:hypothetical protein